MSHEDTGGIPVGRRIYNLEGRVNRLEERERENFAAMTKAQYRLTILFSAGAFAVGLILECIRHFWK